MTAILKTKVHSLLLEAIKAENAIKGTLQRYRKDKDDLVIIASEGFSDEFLGHFKNVKPFDSSCCGRAFGSGTPILIGDVEQDLGFRANLAVAKAAGFRAVKSIPIITGSGEKVGILSVHYKEVKWTTEFNKLNKIIKELALIIEEETN
jgi:GAF domain-containing protein